MEFIDRIIDNIITFFENTDSRYIFIGLLILYTIGDLIVRRKDSLKLTLQYRLFSYVIFVGIIMLSIPTVFTGRFEDVSDLETKKLLYDLKSDHEALVCTTRAFHYLFYATILFAFSIIMPIIKYFKIDKSVE